MIKIIFDLDKNDFATRIEQITYNRIVKENEDEEFQIIAQTTTAESCKNYLSALKLCSQPNIHFGGIEIKFDKDYINDNDDLEIIKNCYLFCEEKNIKFNIKLKKFALESNHTDFIVAKNKAEEFIEKLNSFRIQEKNKASREPSVIEKYMIIYNYVANRFYSEAPDFLDNSMRNWIGLLSGKYAICSGFASTLKFFCDQIFTPKELTCFYQSCQFSKNNPNEPVGHHANNIVYLKDEFYGISGFSYNDTCWDCKKRSHGPQFNYCLREFNDIFNYPYANFYSEDFMFYDTSNPNWKKGQDDLDLMIEEFINSSNMSQTSDNSIKPYKNEEICHFLGVKSEEEIKKEAESYLDSFKGKIFTITHRIDVLNHYEKQAKVLEVMAKKQHSALIKKAHKNLMPKIPNSTFSQALRAVAQFNGLTQEADIENYITKQMENRNSTLHPKNPTVSKGDAIEKN